MKIEFLTLWVDDNLEFSKAIETELKNWLDDMGFELKVLMHKDETNVLQEIKDRDIELIIIDYKLPKKNGDVLIAEIRQSDCYQDIIFYSEGPLLEKRLDGVFFVSKEDAKTRIKELISLKLRRSSDFATLRGWIVADAIELEGMITDLLLQCFTQKEGLNFSERLFGHNSPLDFGPKCVLLSSVLKDLIDSLKAQTVKDEERTKQLESCKNTFNEFMEEVIEIRNAIAHQKIEKSEAGKVIKKKTRKKPTEIILNEPTFIQIRKNLRKHRDNLLKLKSLL